MLARWMAFALLPLVNEAVKRAVRAPAAEPHAGRSADEKKTGCLLHKDSSFSRAPMDVLAKMSGKGRKTMASAWCRSAAFAWSASRNKRKSISESALSRDKKKGRFVQHVEYAMYDESPFNIRMKALPARAITDGAMAHQPNMMAILPYSKHRLAVKDRCRQKYLKRFQNGLRCIVAITKLRSKRATLLITT